MHGDMNDAPSQEELLAALRHVAAVLREAGIPFAVGGGVAAWAHGGPITEHDVDLFIREPDAEAALAALEATGMRTAHTPEGWLVKAWHGSVLVDLIYSPIGLKVDSALIESCPMMDVEAVPMRVLPVEDVLTTKLLALTEHHLDFGPVLASARSLREKVDWESLARRVDRSPFARAFLHLAEELNIAGPPGQEVDQPRRVSLVASQ